MVSINRRFYAGEIYNDIRGLSTDEKPTSDITNGSSYLEIDTGKVYFYDISGNQWHEAGASEGSDDNV